MKKVRLLLIIFLLMFYTNVFASTNTYIRTNDNLRLPSKIKITQDKISDVMSTPSVSAKEKIYDFADLLTDAQEEEIYKSLVSFSKTSGYDAVIVTTKDIGVKDMLHYADDFYQYNDFNKDGLIFVIKKTDKATVYMCPKSFDESNEIFQTYNQNMVKETLRYIYENNIRNGDYYSACTNYVKIINGLYTKYGSGNYRVSSNGEVIKNIPWFAIITLSLTTTFIIVIIIVTKLNSSNKIILADNIGKCVDSNTLFVKTIRDQLVDSEKR